MSLDTDSGVEIKYDKSGIFQYIQATIDGTSVTAGNNGSLFQSWTHVAVTVRKTASNRYLQIYINGNLSSSNTVTSVGTPYISTITMGGGHSTTQHIDHVSLFGKELSSTEVAQLYNGGTGLSDPPPYIATGEDDVVLPYGIFGPVQELFDTHDDISNIGFIYEHLEGSGYFEADSTNGSIEPYIYTAITEKVGADIPDTVVNSGLYAYWDSESRYDRINHIGFFSSVADDYESAPSGHYDSQIYGQGINEEYSSNGSLWTTQLQNVGNSGTEHRFISSSSHQPTGNNSYVFWEYKYGDEEYGATSIYKERVPETINGGTRDFFRTVSYSDPSVHARNFYYQGNTIRTDVSISPRGLNMHYFGINTDTNKAEYSINGGTIVQSNMSTWVPTSGHLRIDCTHEMDEFRGYDRVLSQRELQTLYNDAFPTSLNKPELKKQMMYPKSDGEITNASIMLGTELIENDYNPFLLQEYDHSDPLVSGKAFDIVKDVFHSQAELDHHYCKDFSCLMHKDEETRAADFTFNMGAMRVKPTGLKVRFDAKWFGSGTTLTSYHNGSFTYPDDQHISGIEILDKNNVLISNIPSTDAIMIRGSGDYTSTTNFHTYESSIAIAPGLNDRDLSEVKFRFRTREHLLPDGGNESAHIGIHSVGLEVEGDVNIIGTGLDLYTDGILGANSGIDLYTSAVTSDNSGIDLYTIGNQVQNSSTPLYTISADFYNSGVDLYTFGKGVENSGSTLYIVSYDTSNKSRDMFISGLGVDNASLDMSIWGKDSKNSGMDLFTNGHIGINSGMDLWIEGVNTDSDNMPLFIDATVVDSSANIPMYINATTNLSSFKTLPMYLSVSDNATDNGGMPLFMNSQVTADSNAAMPMFLKNNPETPMNRGVNLYLNNEFQSGEKAQTLYMRGLGGLDGGYVDNGSMPLFMARTEAVERGLSLYMEVNDGSNKGINMFISGGTWSNKALNLTIPSTYDADNSGLNVYVNGF